MPHGFYFHLIRRPMADTFPSKGKARVQAELLN